MYFLDFLIYRAHAIVALPVHSVQVQYKQRSKTVSKSIAAMEKITTKQNRTDRSFSNNILSLDLFIVKNIDKKRPEKSSPILFCPMFGLVNHLMQLYTLDRNRTKKHETCCYFSEHLKIKWQTKIYFSFRPAKNQEDFFHKKQLEFQQ